MKKINIVTVDGYFGQGIPTENTLNVKEIFNKLITSGYCVDIVDIECVARDGIDPSSIYLVGSHQNKTVKKYIDGVLSVTSSLKNINIIPRIELILAHENKGLQSIVARELRLPLISQDYRLSSEYNFRSSKKQSVIKLIDGSGSEGVFIASSDINLFNALLKRSVRELSLNDLIYIFKERLKSIFFRRRINVDARKYFGLKIPYVEQDFIKGLNFDYKVLVFFNNVFVLKRNTRKNDFRASGSGLFEFIDIGDDLLEFSLKVRERLSCPYVSIDVIWDVGECKYRVVEFQCVHFGPYTQMNAPHYYVKMDDGSWNKVKNNTRIEYLIADSVVRYIDNEKNSAIHT